jgi:hypothetical protein
MIKIASYEHINGVPFGADEGDIIRVFGEPSNRRTNHKGELELHYTNYIVRLEAGSKKFREFTLLPGSVAQVNGVPLGWEPMFLATIEKEDPNLVEALGFVLSLKLGLAFSGFHDADPAQMAVHAFRRGDWDMFRHRMKPFHHSR